MSYEFYLILGGTIMLLFGSYLVNRFNYKRRMMSAAALFFALLAQGVPEENAFYRAFTELGLTLKEEKEDLLRICTILQEEASKYRLAHEVVERNF